MRVPHNYDHELFRPDHRPLSFGNVLSLTHPSEILEVGRENHPSSTVTMPCRLGRVVSAAAAAEAELGQPFVPSGCPTTYAALIEDDMP
jgi:hypothetical protein